MDRFTVEDYAAICSAYLSKEQLANVDLEKVFRFAPRLSGHQLRLACEGLGGNGAFNTEAFIEFLRMRQMVSNVDLSEVSPVELHDLKGIDDVIESLEANIVLPFENDALASELKLKPKRGVLLVGPPGTGKTTIGRALARRLRSKFFLIDGTFIAGTRNFYGRIQQVFEEAKNNAPAIIFIDDSDVIFESEDKGLYRYLLTMLDGLESESAGRICVMLTAMDVAALPPALVRSGRVELWLETRLPDLPGRLEILVDALADVPPALNGADTRKLAEETEGLTGADLKRLVSDGKLLYANDRVRNRQARSATEYFVAAVENVRRNRERYLSAEAAMKGRRQPQVSAEIEDWDP